MNPPSILTPSMKDYELLDSGGFEKLERFVKHVLRRPEPQAIWNKSLAESEWKRTAGASFVREDSGDRGRWTLAPGMPEQWNVRYSYREMKLAVRLGLTSFKHVGLFPEQAANWNFIYDTVRSMKRPDGFPSVLNLFAYTGGASLAARSAGASVTHVDSVRQTVSWAAENMEQSGLDGIRWIVDDALGFVRRELRRGRLYDGIILDPPAYGRGPGGEKWILERDIGPLLTSCAGLLSPRGFLVLNLYSMGLSALLAKSAVNQLFPGPRVEEYGELCFPDRAGKVLPLGVFYRAVF